MHALRMTVLGAAMLAACSHAQPAPQPVTVPSPVAEVAPAVTPEVKPAVPAPEIPKLVEVKPTASIHFGEERPKLLGHDEASWRENRRDDVFVTAAPALSAR
jgi:hypothetical protein